MKVEWVRVHDIAMPSADGVSVNSEEVYRNAGILNRGRGLFEKTLLPGSATKYLRLSKLSKNQLVYSKLFGWEGAVAIVPDSFAGAFVSPEFPTFDLDAAIVDPAYLRHVVGWEGFVAQMAGATSGLGQRRQRVNPDRFVGLSIPLPRLEDQLRIAAHLDQTRQVAERNPWQPHWARIFKSRLLEKWTTDAERRPLFELLTPVLGVGVQQESRYEIAGVYSFGRGLLQRPPIRGHETKYKTLTELPLGALVYSKLGAFEGAVAMVDSASAGKWVSPEFPTFTVSSPDAHAGFLRHYVTSPHFQTQLAAVTAGVGARQKRVSTGFFLAQTVPMPGKQAQQGMSRVLDRVDEVEARANRAAVLSSALLPAARNEIFSAMR